MRLDLWKSQPETGKVMQNFRVRVDYMLPSLGRSRVAINARRSRALPMDGAIGRRPRHLR